MTLSNPVTQTIDAYWNYFLCWNGILILLCKFKCRTVTTGIGSQFIVIRSDVDDIVFESSKNPIDPVEIGMRVKI